MYLWQVFLSSQRLNHMISVTNTFSPTEEEDKSFKWTGVVFCLVWKLVNAYAYSHHDTRLTVSTLGHWIKISFHLLNVRAWQVQVRPLNADYWEVIILNMFQKLNPANYKKYFRVVFIVAVRGGVRHSPVLDSNCDIHKWFKGKK